MNNTRSWIPFYYQKEHAGDMQVECFSYRGSIRKGIVMGSDCSEKNVPLCQGDIESDKWMDTPHYRYEVLKQIC